MEKNNEKLIQTLVRGKSSVKTLQNLIRKKRVNGIESGLFDDLLVDILGSFSGGLSMLGSCDSGEICGGPLVDPVPEANSEKKQAPVVKERRGCYKRRKTEDSRVEISGTMVDGYAWRKYGQKEILNSKYPRCYFRCTYKPAHGCKAQRQVQKQDDGSDMYHITYFGRHTCPGPNYFSKHRAVLDFKDSKNQQYFSASPSTITNIPINPFVKQEVDSKDQSTDVSDNVSSANEGHSAPPLGWNEVLRGDFGAPFMGFDHEEYSSASTSSHSYLMNMDFINDDGFEFDYQDL